MKEIKLVTDNAIPAIVVITNEREIEWACKYVLGWRTPTKDYDTIYERFENAGSYNYDRVIKYLQSKQRREREGVKNE